MIESIPMPSTAISVLVPAFRSEKYLRACLDSLVGQDFPYPYEILVFAFGSDDRSGEIIEEYERKMPDRIFYKKCDRNYGVSATRNALLLSARGEYVTFVDSDDTVRKDYLSFLYRMAKKNKVDIVTCGFYQNPAFKHIILDRYHKKNTTGEETLRKYFARTGNKIRAYCWGRLYKASFLREQKVFFPSDLNLYEDWVFFFRSFLAAGKVSFYRKPLYYYRSVPTSLTHQEKDFASSCEHATEEGLLSIQEKNPELLSRIKIRLPLLLHLLWASYLSRGSRKKKTGKIYREEKKKLSQYLKEIKG